MLNKFINSNNVINFMVLALIVSASVSPDKGATAATLLVFYSAYLVFNNKFFTVGKETIVLIIFASVLFLCFLAGAIWQPEGLKNGEILKNINYPFHWVFLILFLFLFKYVEVSWKVLSWAVALAGIGGGIFAFYQTHYLGQVRAYGFNNPLIFGEIMVVLDLFGWMLMLHSIKLKKHFYTVLLMISSLAAFYAALLSSARGAWIAYLLMIAVWLVLLYNAKQLSLKSLLKGTVFIRIIAMVVIFSFVAQTPQYKHAVDRSLSEVNKLKQSNYGSSAGLRLLLWKIAWLGIQEHPYGVGTKNFQQYKTQLINEEGIQLSALEKKSINRLTHAHNQYLSVLVENGWHTFIVFVSLFLYLLFYFWKNLSSKIELVNIYAGMGLLLTSSYMVFALTQNVFSHNLTSVFFIFLSYMFFAQIQYLKGKATNLSDG